MNATSENSNISYTNIVKDLKTFKELALELDTKNKQLTEKITELEAKNTTLTNENEKHIADKDAIFKILKPEN